MPESLARRLDENAIYHDDAPFCSPPTLGIRDVRVFISKSGLADFRHEQLLSWVRQRLSAEAIVEMSLERSEYSGFGSLAEVKRTIGSCSGIVVVGHRDAVIREGVWREGTPEEKSLNGRSLTTAWLQIEVGMAIMAGLPALIVADSGIFGGIFDLTTSEYLIHQADPNNAQSSARFSDWCMSVHEVARQRH